MPKCKICEIKFTPKHIGQKCCSYEHEILFYQKNQAEMKKKELASKAQFKKDKAQIRERAKRLSYYKNKAWDLFSIHVRKSYADDNGMSQCYTCDKVLHWKELQAGHCIPGRNGAVLFDEDTVRPQCYDCNCVDKGRGSGMHHIFAAKLIKENGEVWYDQKLIDAKKELKRNKSDYLDLIEQYKRGK